MIKAAIWDFGGVMTTSPFQAFQKFERDQNLPENFIRTINARNPDDNAWARLERAQISLSDFDEIFAAETRAAGCEVRGRDVIKLLAGAIRPEMVYALKRLKPVMKLGCITNNAPVDSSLDSSRENPSFYRPDVMALFDHVIESAKVGLRKPDPQIYRLMLAALAVEPEECVYLDDLGVNLKPARALKMATIKVEDSWRALAELERLTGLSLTPKAPGI